VNYHKRFKKLDEVFASDVVGDGTTGILMGPFEAAQGRFFTGQVIPLVVGAFGDVNEALEKVLKQVAKVAAAETDGLTISPLINTEWSKDTVIQLPTTYKVYQTPIICKKWI
jgi:hypothetical protein